jgi:hypothetical protein
MEGRALSDNPLWVIFGYKKQRDPLLGKNALDTIIFGYKNSETHYWGKMPWIQ